MNFPWRRSFALLLLLTYSKLTASRDCYFPNGQLARYDLPCSNDDEEHTGCCDEDFICTTNGICASQGDEIYFARGSCTDKNFLDDACPQFCIDPGKDILNSLQPMLPCDDPGEEKFYCAYNVTRESQDYLEYGPPDCADQTEAWYLPGKFLTYPR